MKTIDNFLTKDKESQQEANKSRSEAMTLEEMAVNVQERKILGHERKIDMNIIMFVSLCLCGLIIINVVLYFLIGESKSNTLQPIPATQDTRNLLKERREERVALLSESDLVDTNLPINDTEIAGEGAEINVAVNDIANGDDSSPGSLQNNLSAIETTTADESQVVQDNSPEVVKSTVQELQDQPLQKQEVKDTAANEIKVSDIETDVSDVIEQQAAELKSEPEQTEEVPFDVAISVGSTIQDWTAAWSAQDVDTYLSYYSDTFVSEAGMNIVEWRAHRAIRLTKPEWISIGVENLKINVIEDGARAEFVQEYNASNYSDKELKKMIFRKVDGQWKIFDERATPVD